MKQCKLTWIELFVLTCVFLIAFGLRYYYFLERDVWMDEILVYIISSSYDFKSLLLISHWDGAHPPLLYLFTRFILFLNGFKFVSVNHLRIISLAFSSTAVLPVYLFARKIIKSKYALFVPLWYAVSYLQVLVGFQYRPYALMQFFLPIACFSFWEEHWTKKGILFFNILFIFLFFLDYASIWFFVAFFCHLIINNFYNGGRLFLQK